MAVVLRDDVKVHLRPGLVRRVLATLPRGGLLGAEDFARRQRLVIAVLWGHAVGLFVFGLARGVPVPHLVAEDALVVGLIATASQSRLLGARIRAAISAVGLLTCSAILVHLSDGSIEMHFHFFVMVALIALYHDWWPFLVAIAFVVVQHGLIGVLAPQRVYDHPSAWASPWKWAAIHAGFVLAASAAQVASWRTAEDEYDRSRSSSLARERRFRALIEHSLDAVCIMSATGEILYQSESSERVLGRRITERVGQSAFDFIHPDDVGLAEALLQSVLSAPGASAADEVRGRHGDGSWRWLDLCITNLHDEPAVGGLVINYRDITQRKALEEDLAHQAFHDSLSGLANRALFLDRLEHALLTQAPGSERRVAVLFVDIDDFKTVNDALGHHAGDAVLRVFSGRLQRGTKLSDTCARLGGDEFAVLIEGLESPTEAQEMGQRLLAALHEPVDIEGDSVCLSASVGIAVGNGTESAANLMRNADLAMYRAKRSGKARCEVFEAGMHHAAVERLALREDLRRGIDAGELVNHYQPVVDLQTRRIVGAEALVRWEHPTRGLLGPATFIDFAEETSLIVPLGVAVLERACLDAASWLDPEMRISVNLSTRQLNEPDIVGAVARAITQSGLAASRLTLEITESVLIGNPAEAARKLDALKGLGVMIALDDFGTGFSSLSYLARFPVDMLKIDKSFIDALEPDAGQDGTALLDAIIDMSSSLRLHVIAEGIEGEAQAQRLIAMGCTTGQGFHFAEPMAHDELLVAMAANRGAEPASAQGAVEKLAARRHAPRPL